MDKKEKLSVSLPSAAAWEAKRAPFRSTVGTDVPITPYGEAPKGLKGLARRVVRKCVHWYVEELATEQNRVNRALAERIEKLEERVKELEGEKKP